MLAVMCACAVCVLNVILQISNRIVSKQEKIAFPCYDLPHSPVYLCVAMYECNTIQMGMERSFCGEPQVDRISDCVCLRSTLFNISLRPKNLANSSSFTLTPEYLTANVNVSNRFEFLLLFSSVFRIRAMPESVYGPIMAIAHA